jgi:transcription elongation factor Elf1
MSKKRKYPNRSKYFNFRKTDRVRYFKFKAKCPNCGKVCVEDFLVDRDTKIMRATLVCHRCGPDIGNDAESFLIWKRTF